MKSIHKMLFGMVLFVGFFGFCKKGFSLEEGGIEKGEDIIKLEDVIVTATRTMINNYETELETWDSRISLAGKKGSLGFRLAAGKMKEEIETSFNPKFGFLYHLTETASLKGAMGKAFSAPTLYELYHTRVGSWGTKYQGNPELDPEEIISYELGIDQRMGSKLLGRVTLFYNDADNFIYSVRKEKGGYQKENIGDVETGGLEIEVGARFDDDMNTIKLDDCFTLDAKLIKKLAKNIEVSLEVNDLNNKTWKDYYRAKTPGRTINIWVKTEF